MQEDPVHTLLPAQDSANGMPETDNPVLTTGDVSHFKQRGFIVKRGLIPAEVLRPWLDRLWQTPPRGVSREDPSTWADPGEHWPNSTDDHGPFTADGYSTSRDPHHLTPNSQWRAHILGHDPGFVDATSTYPPLLRLVEELLGGTLRRPTRNRGIYSIFPRPSLRADPSRMLAPHLDMVPLELNGALYLDHVGPQSGAFTVWPGSHIPLWDLSIEDVNFVPPSKDEYEAVREDIEARVQPLEFAGEVGDVILVHPFLLHSTGINTSKRIRHATILDFNRVWPSPTGGGEGGRRNLMWEVLSDPEGGGDLTRVEPDGTVRLSEEEGSKRAVVRWHHDCMEWPPFTPKHEDGEGMWTLWNLGRVPARGDIVAERPWWEKYGMDLPPSHRLLREIACYDSGAELWRLHSS